MRTGKYMYVSYVFIISLMHDENIYDIISENISKWRTKSLYPKTSLSTCTISFNKNHGGLVLEQIPMFSFFRYKILLMIYIWIERIFFKHSC